MNQKRLLVSDNSVIMLLIFFLFAFLGCEKKGYTEDPSDAKNDTLAVTKIVFNENFHDFGTTPEGELVNHKFTFKNTGTKPLKIYRVRSSCGCTTPEYSDDLVQPGATGFIKVQYSAKNKDAGEYNKKVTVITNTQPKVNELKIHVTVVEPKNKSSKIKPKKNSDDGNTDSEKKEIDSIH